MNGFQMHQLILSGLGALKEEQTYINDINLYPVADGDTGTNLVMTMQGMIDFATPSLSIGKTFDNYSKGASYSAKGNSGFIFAEFIRGMALMIHKYETVNVSQMAYAIEKGVRTAYESVDKPQEGTIITVMLSWSDYIMSHFQEFYSIDELFTKSYEVAERKTVETKEVMAQITNVQLEDAGAVGFIVFLKGILEGLKIKVQETSFAKYSQVEIKEKQKDYHNDHIVYRYCIEHMLYIESYKQCSEFEKKRLEKQMRSALKVIGDEIIVTHIGECNAKIHLHSDSPKATMHEVEQYGQVIHTKIDDMVHQNRIKYSDSQRIGILTDSIADVPNAYALNHHVHVLPTQIIFDKNVYLDRLSIDYDVLKDKMDGAIPYPTTSMPSPMYVDYMLKKLSEKYDYLFILPVGKKLSGTYQMIKSYISKQQNKEKYILIDTKSNSGAQSLIVQMAAQLIESGLSVIEIEKKLKEAVERREIYVCLYDINNLYQSGRVPKVMGKFADRIGFIPILSLDKKGKGIASEIAFKPKSAKNKIYRKVKNSMKNEGIESFGISYTDNYEKALQYAKEISEITGLEPAFIEPVSTSVAIYAGDGAIAISYIRRNKNE